MVSKEERARIIARIKKCLALGKSSEPHEAAAAIRQAQKLMEKFGIEADDVEGDVITSELVITPEPPKRKYPMYIIGIYQAVANAFGVSAIFETTRKYGRSGHDWDFDLRLGVRYFGTGNSAMMAKYTHEVMWNAMMKAWRQHQKAMWREAMPGERQAFWLGWLAAVDRTIQNFARPEGHSERLKKAMDEFAGFDLPDAETNKMDMTDPAMRNMLRTGHAAGSEFSIHRPMEGSVQRGIGYDAPALGKDD